MSTLARRRRRTIPRRHAAASLRQRHCMLEVVGDCSGALYNVGLRDEHDHNAVLICAGHRTRLRALGRREVETLCRYLRHVFLGAAA